MGNPSRRLRLATRWTKKKEDPIQALAGERPVSDAQRAYLTEKFHLDKTGIGGFKMPADPPRTVRVWASGSVYANIP